MAVRFKSILLPLAAIVSCVVCACHWRLYRVQEGRLTELSAEIVRLEPERIGNAELHNTLLQAAHLERLRSNRLELVRLRSAVESLTADQQQSGTAEVRNLRLENEQIKSQLGETKQTLVHLEARHRLEENQVALIRQAFLAYAKKNEGKFPADFTELRYYLPADVYPTIETNRFEILPEAAEAISETAVAIVRSRQADTDNTKVYLYSDGHVERRTAEAQ